MKQEKNYKFPFKENIEDGYYIRTFNSTTNEEEFVWHRDREDRIIECNHETNWLFQRDNELPITFDKIIFIEKETWHRVIKGDGDLQLKIKKLI
jgi:hypothetical protein